MYRTSYWSECGEIRVREYRKRAEFRAFRAAVLAFAMIGVRGAAATAPGAQTQSAHVNPAPAQDNQTSGPMNVTQVDRLPSLKLVRELRRKDYTFGVTWSPDSATLAAYSIYGGLVTIWNAGGKVIQELHRPGARYVGNALAFLSGHSEIVTPPASYQSNDIAFSIFNVESGQVIHEVPGPYPDRPRNVNAITALAISPDQSTLAVVYGMALPQPVALYSTQDWRRVAILLDPSYASTEYTKPSSQKAQTVSFSPDGRLLAVALPFDVLIFDIGSQKVVSRIHVLDPKRGCCIRAINFSPDSSAIAVANIGNAQVPLSVPKQIPSGTPVEVFRVMDGARISAYPPIAEPAEGLGWSRDGRFIVFITLNALHLWDPADPKVFRSIDLPGTEGVSLSPNGRWLAVCSDYSVDIFEIQD